MSTNEDWTRDGFHGQLKSSTVGTRLRSDEMDVFREMCDRCGRSPSWVVRFAIGRLAQDMSVLDEYGRNDA